ncbi:ogr/Delta-like zinc finger family protein [Scandinavium goeteborgense]|uniref:Ogr/Delta-like zinc finger protein n=1 Tax=Scandinavium goeteborgense TaxID=1851514 RepID=A0A4R6EN60_SCAGO|nr:ogr/Delta-like zinc finger family protein [Scandinavium goeteborgense]TDN60654.1 Ogr/Delta-like zinc finger protein [Scandinavium goeteborgense]
MRMMKMYCPTCKAAATIGKTNRKHPQIYDVYCYCSNSECGHSFVMNVTFSHSISPSALSGQGRVKELIDALPEEERDKALELLLAAKGSL